MSPAADKVSSWPADGSNLGPCHSLLASPPSGFTLRCAAESVTIESDGRLWFFVFPQFDGERRIDGGRADGRKEKIERLKLEEEKEGRRATIHFTSQKVFFLSNTFNRLLF